MKYTSAQASKLLKKLKTEEKELLDMESRGSSFIAAIEESIEDVRPQYDYSETQKKLMRLEEQIRKVKHAINTFNTTTKVDGFDMTIDEMLVLLPQLSYRREKLEKMAGKLPKTRVAQRFGGQPSNFIEYTYANYDIAEVEKDLAAVREEIDKAQLSLDKVNNTVTMDIEL